MKPTKPKAPSLDDEVKDLHAKTVALAARVAAELPERKKDQVWKTRDGRLIRVIEVKENGDIRFRTLHSPPGLAVLPYDAQFLLPAKHLFVLSTKISD